jgi:hypothetical protein
MAQGATNPGGRVTSDPGEIRAAMAATRGKLTEELSALRDRLIGSRGPTTTNEGKTVATQKGTKGKGGKAAGSAKSGAKSGGAKPPAGAKVSATRGGAAKRSRSNTSAIVSVTKEVLGEVLAGAAAGAVKGAAEAVAPRVDAIAESADKAMPAKSSRSKASRKK